MNIYCTKLDYNFVEHQFISTSHIGSYS